MRSDHTDDQADKSGYHLMATPYGSSELATSRPAILKDHARLSLLDGKAVKRAFDIAASALGLIVFSPTFLLVALAIKIESRGPVFHRQLCFGYGGSEIRAFKFRFDDISKPGRNGLRVSNIGRILERAGVNGLLQLVNVFSGEMSIVGPELFSAAPPTIFEEQMLLHSRRPKIIPGLIGWAQVNARWGDTNPRETIQRRVAYDLYYIRNWSLLFDMKILLTAVFSKGCACNSRVD
jgi:lipopolysaccharide/colanic/teichoic acid biosynthesis glycosyltransferase